MNQPKALARLRTNPWPVSLLALLIYAAWFLAPLLFARPQPQPATPDSKPSEIAYLLEQMPNQIGLVLLLTGIVALLVWWRPVGFTRHTPGSLKFTLLPLAATAVFLVTGIVLNVRSGGNFLGTNGGRELLLVVLVSLLVGYTEELMFRGILFHGATARFKLVGGAVVSSLIFGLFHFINLFGGQGFGWTVSQVVHAATDGFMYAAIRLITGSLWPTLFLHGLWDLSISAAHTGMVVSGSNMAASLASLQAGGISIQPLQVLPGLLYGSFVLWRWAVRNKTSGQAG